ncbi:MAG: ATP-grasp domain-containing protein [Myxococcota bacterium]|nr:ATP-grasp domain-containing protein [Myxococcota bacterium]
MNAEYAGLTLIIPDKPDSERDAVAEAWSAQGGEVLRLGRFWEPPELEPARVRVYGNDTFCLVLAQKLHLDLVSPADDLLRRVPSHLLGRQVTILTLREALRSEFPGFFKPVTPKEFLAQVYGQPEDLERQTRGLPPETAIVRSEVVRFEAEARSFVLDGEILDVSVYQGGATVPRTFLGELSAELPLPAACVVDAGLVMGSGWAFLEANAAWGAGLNGCDASLVLPCIERASRSAA